MSEIITCDFVSSARFVGGRECGAPVTHSFDGALLCREHYIYESGVFPLCKACRSPRWEDVAVFEQEHTCSVGDAGGDCMCYENAHYCTCEEDARVVLCAQCEEYRRPSHHEEMCESCLEDAVAEDRFIYATYYSQ